MDFVSCAASCDMSSQILADSDVHGVPRAVLWQPTTLFPCRNVRGAADTFAGKGLEVDTWRDGRWISCIDYKIKMLRDLHNDDFAQAFVEAYDNLPDAELALPLYTNFVRVHVPSTYWLSSVLQRRISQSFASRERTVHQVRTL